MFNEDCRISDWATNTLEHATSNIVHKLENTEQKGEIPKISFVSRSRDSCLIFSSLALISSIV